MASRTLLATAGPWISGSSLGDVLGTPELSTVDVLTGQTSLEALLACGTKYGAAIVLCDSGKMSLAPAFLGALVKSLEPGARVSVHTAAAASSISQVSEPCMHEWRCRMLSVVQSTDLFTVVLSAG